MKGLQPDSARFGGLCIQWQVVSHPKQHQITRVFSLSVHPGQSSSKDMEQARHRPIEGHILFRPTSFKAIPGNMQQHAFFSCEDIWEICTCTLNIIYIYYMYIEIYTYIHGQTRGKRYMRYVSRLYNPVYRMG